MTELTSSPAPTTGPEPPAQPGAVALSRRAGLVARAVGLRYSGFALWALFIIIFALWIPDTFLATSTAKSIAGDQAITVMLALGALFTLSAGQYDLSCAQNLGLSAVVSSSLMVNSHVAPLPAVLLTLALGAGIGAANGLIVAVVGVNSFIATLGMSSILLALTEQISNDQFIGPLPASFQATLSHEPLGVPVITVYAVLLGAIVWYVLEHTPVGRRVYATGANADAARLAGVRTGRNVFWSFVATGTIAALAGTLLAARIGQTSSGLGPPYLLPAFAACFLGTTQIKLGRFNVWGTLLAIYLLATGVKGLQLAGGSIWITDLFNGVALIGAVSVAVIAQRRRQAPGSS
ncbi:MAG: transporter permease [Conexibacter sp.]|nr:transporter permease [Conexibacter sp.]